MIARVTRAKSGISEYLLNGVKKDSIYTRSEKDKVIPIYGNLEILKQTEEYLNKTKNYKDNYLHITISYSREDINKMDNMNDDEIAEMKRDIILTYIKHHTSGYDLENEVIAYAETHKPKIKQENNKDRYEHEHIIIALYNPLNDTKLQTTFYNNSFIDDTLQAYVNKKYGLSHPRSEEHTREERQYISENGLLKKEWTERLKHLNNSDELIHTLNNKYGFKKDIDYKIAGSKNFKYIKLINKGKNKNGLCDINLNNKELAHLVVLNNKEFIPSRDKGIKELEKILSSYYEKRIEQIDKRRSIATKEAIKEIYKEETKDNEYSLSAATYQQKIFYKHYGHLIDNDLKGYFIDKKEENTKFINKAKNINVEDKGDKIVSHSNDNINLNERVKLMIDIAEAKGWNLEEVNINGREEFKKEVTKQIAARLRERELEKEKTINKTLHYTEAEAIKKELETRPTSPIQQQKREENNKQLEKESEQNFSLQLLKTNLKAATVLNYAKDKYKINIDDYEITADNKINNKTNKQKPKNVIDFLQKECNLTTKEAIELSKTLFNNQPLNINTNEKEINTMPIKLNICNNKTTKDDKGRLLALNKWQQVEVSKYSELAAYMKTNPYSMANYGSNLTDKGSERHNKNIESFNNVLIYDIDNDRDDKLSIEAAVKLLEAHNISAMILPSKSHLKEKFTDSGKSKGIYDRYRIVIPTKEALKSNDINIYKEFQELTSKALKLDKYIDKQISQNPSTFYYPSPLEAQPTIIKSNNVLNISSLEKQAISNIKEREEKKAAELLRVAELKKDIKQYQEHNHKKGENLTYTDTQKIMQLDIRKLINTLEKSENYKDGSYEMIKTSAAKYSIISDNVIHDFKSDKTFNNITYLQNKYNTTNLNSIAKELENLTGESYLKVNYERVKEVVANSIKFATNDKTMEEAIKKQFNCNYCKLEKYTITIADKTIKLEDIQISKADIVKNLQDNRKKQEAAAQKKERILER